MSSLSKYLEKKRNQRDQEKNALVVPSSKMVSLEVAGVLKASQFLKMPTDSVEEFSHKVSELATSDFVLNKLSDDIGEPKELETEDEFVDRAKLALTNILKNELSK